MEDDAVTSFQYLVDGVPGIITQLEDIIKTSKDGQKETQTEDQVVEESNVLIQQPRGSGSIRSRRSRDVQPAGLASEQAQPLAVQEQVPTLAQVDALRLAQRKRKTASICSTRGTAPNKYRSRNMVVLYYDGDLQKRFETAVRSIGACRNWMRKGKMAAMVDGFSPTASSASDESPDEDLASIRKTTGHSMTTRSKAKSDSGLHAFDEADSFLDKAQSLCERAAHQVLRDGECALEINKAKEHIANARKLGEAELPTLRNKAEKAAERRRLSAEQKKADGVDSGEKEKDLTEKVAPDDPLGSPASLKLEVDELEVDESEDEFDDSRPVIETLQLGKFHMRSAGRLRSKQLAA